MSHETAMQWAAFCAGGTIATLICWIGTRWIMGPARQRKERRR